MSKRRQRELARQAYADHASISGCLGTFEATLAAAPDRNEPWMRRLRAELAPLIDCRATTRSQPKRMAACCRRSR